MNLLVGRFTRRLVGLCSGIGGGASVRRSCAVPVGLLAAAGLFTVTMAASDPLNGAPVEPAEVLVVEPSGDFLTEVAQFDVTMPSIPMSTASGPRTAFPSKRRLPSCASISPVWG